MDDLNESIKKILSTLPKELQDFITGAEWMEGVEVIAKKYSLNEEKEGLLDFEVLSILVGLLHPKELTKNIETKLGLSPEIAAILTTEIFEEVIPEDIADGVGKMLDAADAIEPKKIIPNQTQTTGEIKSIPVSVTPTSVNTQTQPTSTISPSTPTQPSVTPSNLPTDYHDPMPMKIVSEPEKVPMINTQLTRLASLPRQEAVLPTPAALSKNIPLQKSPAVTASIQNIKKEETKSEINDKPLEAPVPTKKYEGPDPYREQPVP